MPNGIEEITNSSKPEVHPVEVESRIIETKPEVEMVSARGIEQENFVDPIPDKPTETIKIKDTSATPCDLGEIPGVKEVEVKGITDSRERIGLSDLRDPKTGESLNFSMKRFLRETMNGGMINVMIRKFGLEGIDLEKEAELIKNKKSRLSRRQRDAVLALENMRRQQRDLLENISKELMGKTNPTDEDLRKLLDSVEDATTNTEEVATAVANEIVRKAVESANAPAEEIPTSVEEAMEAAKVEYTPGEGGNDEVTTKALHDAVKNHGRTKFRGVFDSLDLVDNPQVGDVVHTIVPDDKGNHSGEELVYTYIGPNNWKLEGSYIQEELPGPIPEEPAKSDDGSIPLTIGE